MGSPSPGTQTQMDYIKRLEERNRMKRRAVIGQRGRQEREEQDRESGFRVLFAGANTVSKDVPGSERKERPRQRQRQRQRKRGSGNSNNSGLLLDKFNKQDESSARRRWGAPSTAYTLHSDHGKPIKVTQPPRGPRGNHTGMGISESTPDSDDASYDDDDFEEDESEGEAVEAGNAVLQMVRTGVAGRSELSMLRQSIQESLKTPPAKKKKESRRSRVQQKKPEIAEMRSDVVAPPPSQPSERRRRVEHNLQTARRQRSPEGEGAMDTDAMMSVRRENERAKSRGRDSATSSTKNRSRLSEFPGGGGGRSSSSVNSAGALGLDAVAGGQPTPRAVVTAAAGENRGDLATPPQTMTALMDKIEDLTPKQQKFLLQMLDNVDQENGGAEEGRRDTPTGENDDAWREMQRGLSQSSGVPEQEEGEGAAGSTNLRLRMHTSWGGTRVIGMAGIQLLNGRTGRPIALDASSIHLVEGLSARAKSAQDLRNLVDGVNDDASDDHMWLGRLPSENQALDLCIRRVDRLFQDSDGLTLRVWNYNKSAATRSFGVKDADVVLGDACVWSGVVDKAGETGARFTDIAVVPCSAATAFGTAVQPGDDVPSAGGQQHQQQPPIWLVGKNAGAGAAPIRAGGRGDIVIDDGNGGDSAARTERRPASGRRSAGSSQQRDGEQQRPRSDRRRHVAPPTKTLSSSPEGTVIVVNPANAKSVDDLPAMGSLALSRNQSLLSQAVDGTSTQRRQQRGGKSAEEGENLLPMTLEREKSELSQMMVGDRQQSHEPLHHLTPVKSRLRTIPASPDSPLSALVSATESSGNFGGVSLNTTMATTDKHRGGGTASSTTKVLGLLQPDVNSLMQESWDSLEHFSRHNRSRLAASVASGIIGPQSGSLLTSPAAEQQASPTVANAGEGNHGGVLSLSEQRRRARKARAEQVLAAVGQAEAAVAELNAITGRAPQQRETSALDKLMDDVVAAPAPAAAALQQQPSLLAEAEAALMTMGGDVVDDTPVKSLADELLEEAAAAMGDGDVSDDIGDISAAEASIFGSGSLIDSPLGLPGDNCDPCEASMVDIPVLPCGKTLKLNIFSTWGDPHYVGLAGIELFDQAGKPVSLRNPRTQTSADPPDINTLPEYAGVHDPRTVDKLFDGVNNTCDDLHVWLAPFEKGTVNTVTAHLNVPTTLSMLRIWNYNKSRTHSYRGAKWVSVMLDDDVVFEGELRKATGILDGPELCSEVILFTLDGNALGEIERYDERQGYGADATQSIVRELRERLEQQRPVTADTVATGCTAPAGTGAAAAAAEQSRTLRRRTRAPSPDADDDDLSIAKLHGERPRTAAIRADDSADDDGKDDSSRGCVAAADSPGDLSPLNSIAEGSLANILEWPEVDSSVASDKSGSQLIQQMLDEVEETGGKQAPRQQQQTMLSNNIKMAPRVRAADLPVGRVLRLRLMESWGDMHYVGLAGIRVLVGPERRVFPLSINNLWAKPRDLATLGSNGDPRTLDKLVDDVGLGGADDEHMWLVPLGEEGEEPVIEVDLGESVAVSGVVVWNYNKSEEDVARGVRLMEIDLDGRSLSGANGVSVRSGIGHGHATRAVQCDERQQQQQQQQYRCGGEGGAVEEEVERAWSTCGQFVPLWQPGSGPHTAYFADQRGKADVCLQASRTFATPLLRQDYETPLLPCGQLFRFVLHASWGDPYYIGLDAIEMFDATGKRLSLQPQQIYAVPHSLADIGQDDVRVPGNLAVYSGMPGQGQQQQKQQAKPNEHAWIAPAVASMRHSGNRSDEGEDDNLGLAPTENEIYVLFDEPQVVSLIKVWNYWKTPRRGVREFSVWADGALIYRGGLAKASGDSARGDPGVPASAGAPFGQPIIFTSDSAAAKLEAPRVFYSGNENQDVLCIDERQVMVRSRAMRNGPDYTAEGVVADPSLRPTTSVPHRHTMR